MKRIKLFAVILIMALVSCSSEDNYSEPTKSITGGVYDLKSKGLDTEVLIPAQSPNGARIRAYEGNSNQSLNFWCKLDGSFSNERVFAADYRVIPEGPFIVLPSDTAFVSVPTAESVKFFVEPFLRIQLKGTLEEQDKVKYEFTISKSDKWPHDLNQYVLLYSTTQYADNNNYVKRIVVNVSSDKQDEVLDQMLTNSIEGVQTDKPIYLRVGARTKNTNYYNYSEVIKLN